MSMSMTGRLGAVLGLGDPDAPSLDADQILSLFVSYVEDSGLSLYAAQEEAILELLAGKHVVLATPTGSGKSLVATALHFKAMAEGKRSVYTCPIKALVNEKFFALCQAFGAEHVGMLTGDASINRDAPILCCTAEILSNVCLREAEPRVGYVIMDEFHYYSDKERGIAWQVPLLSLKGTTFLLMSATLGDVTDISAGLTELTGREVAEVRSSERPVPLDYEYRETPLHETIEALLESGRAPIYLVNFTQRSAAERAQDLMSVNFTSKEDKEVIRQALEGTHFDTPYAKELQRFVRHGLGLHHAGLLPKYRLMVEKLAQKGLLKVISGTDTLGMGVNIPIRTVLFTQLCKYDGEKTMVLGVRDFLQISGRAGRRGFDDRGSVVVQAPEHVVENLRLEDRKAAGKKVVKRQPPTKGYAHWDRTTFDRLLTRAPEPLEPRFEVTHGLLLNLLQAGLPGRGGGYRRLISLIARAHTGDRGRHLLRVTAARCFRTLHGAGLIELTARAAGARGRNVVVAADLQRDFSLNQTLSLYLYDALTLLDRQGATYALDVLSLVEAILEQPHVVLYAQLNQLKGIKIAEWKAQGMEYDQRMEELEKLEWPKPNADFVYDSFNAFAARHPWVGSENIHPKSIARDMIERYQSFNEYVREYDLERSEGVLLRYLSETYKTLAQNVPESYRDDAVLDLLAQLRATIRAVDSSLLDEWERMRAAARRGDRPAEVKPAPGSPGSPGLIEGPVLAELSELAADPRALAARIRADLHRVLVALSRKDYAGAAAGLFDPEAMWSAEKLAEALAPYWETHASLIVTPEARRPHRTTLTQVGPAQWEARQTLVDPAGDEDWMLDCLVDLDAPRPAGSDLELVPLIALRRIGI